MLLLGFPVGSRDHKTGELTGLKSLQIFFPLVPVKHIQSIALLVSDQIFLLVSTMLAFFIPVMVELIGCQVMDLLIIKSIHLRILAPTFLSELILPAFFFR